MSKYFIGTYTNWCKEYCDEQFFKRLGEIQRERVTDIWIVDNTDPRKHIYLNNISDLARRYMCKEQTFMTNIGVNHPDHKFHNNVLESTLHIRGRFLTGNYEHLLIIESDVIPPIDLLARLDKTIATLPDDWGILGCLYYEGFHDYTKTGIHETHHALSGCTVYRREVVERYPFRISAENWAAFPDAWISYDVQKEGKYKIFNDHDIRCEHLQFIGTCRQSKPI